MANRLVGRSNFTSSSRRNFTAAKLLHVLQIFKLGPSERLEVIRMCMHVIHCPPDEKLFTEMLQVLTG